MAKHNPILSNEELNAIADSMNSVKVNFQGRQVTMAEAAASSKEWADAHPRRESLQKNDIITLAAGSVARPLQFRDVNGNETNYIGFYVTVTRGAETLAEPIPVSFGAFTKRTFAVNGEGSTIDRKDAKFRFGKAFPWHFEAFEQTMPDGSKRITQMRVLDEEVRVTLSESAPVRVCGAYNNTSKSYGVSRNSENFAYAKEA